MAETLSLSLIVRKQSSISEDPKILFPEAASFTSNCPNDTILFLKTGSPYL